MTDENSPIWGVKAIAPAAKLTEREAYYMLEKGLLPAGKVGKTWVTTPKAIQDYIAAKIAAGNPAKVIPEGRLPNTKNLDRGSRRKIVEAV